MRISGQGLGPGLTRVATRRSVIFSVDGLEFVFAFFGDAQTGSSSNAPPARARPEALRIARRLKPVWLPMISPSEREMEVREATSSSKPWNYIFVQGEEEAVLWRSHSNFIEAV